MKKLDRMPRKRPTFTMVYLPIAMIFYGVLVMFGVVQWQSAKKVQLTIEAQQASTQFRHDMLHHVRIASGFLAEEQVQAAQEYLGHIGNLVTTPNLGAYCESRTGNITISWFASEATRLGIDFRCEADIPTEHPEYSTDLCMELANALQNALEASQQVRKNPYISVVAARQGNTLLLRAENRFDGRLRQSEHGCIPP